MFVIRKFLPAAKNILVPISLNFPIHYIVEFTTSTHSISLKATHATEQTNQRAGSFGTSQSKLRHLITSLPPPLIFNQLERAIFPDSPRPGHISGTRDGDSRVEWKGFVLLHSYPHTTYKCT